MRKKRLADNIMLVGEGHGGSRLVFCRAHRVLGLLTEKRQSRALGLMMYRRAAVKLQFRKSR